jgi:hypothetical protein
MVPKNDYQHISDLCHMIGEMDIGVNFNNLQAQSAIAPLGIFQRRSVSPTKLCPTSQ